MRIQQVRFKNLNSLVGEWEIAKSEVKAIEDPLSKNKGDRTKALEAQKTALAEMEKVKAYLGAHACDEVLVTQLAGIAEQIGQAKTAGKEVSLKKGLVDDQNKQFDLDEKDEVLKKTAVASQDKKHKAAHDMVTKAKEALNTHLGDRLLREYRTERDHLMREMVHLKTISDLESERKRLADGKPCPLCGSKDHPFAQGNVPEMDETEQQIRDLSTLIDRAELMETQIKALEAAEKEAGGNVLCLEKLCDQAGHKRDVSKESLTRLQGELCDATELFSKVQTSILAKLLPLGIGELSENSGDAVLSDLKHRLEQWQVYQMKQVELEAQINGLASDVKQLDGNIATRKKDREINLAQALEKKLTDTSLEDLQKSQGDIQSTLDVIKREMGAMEQSLSDNKDAKAKIREKQSLIEAQKAECLGWENLHLLIGSADGKKYRNFAQGLTFELMVSHANRQLVKMTDRYLLVRDEAQPLELSVVDNYQAGEIRSTKNLSGGERFIVSLALALGLSNMASRKVRVDSLFLDEGFGTLDEESLDTALETLAGLQQDGKLIGVISHVPALKERISTQIQVTPHAGGTSMISGPGCARSGVGAET
ncbi:MAG: hypothetical protein GY809_15245 [Planctomycetes bacterium]|nr:hypothetical protein [Planctomycetota bacterium]